MVRSRPIAVCVTLFCVVSLLTGCALVARTAVNIVISIATKVVVDEGAQYIHQILHPEQANGAPTLVVSYTNAAGDGVGTIYAIDKTSEIAVSIVSGEVHLVGDGHGLAVTVSAGTTATIRIGPNAGAPVSGDAENVAVTIDGILSWSGQSRSALGSALADLGQCGDITSDVATLQSVADARSHQIDALQNLATGALPNGDSIRATLVEALHYSFDADQAFVRWGQHVAPNQCAIDSDYREAQAHSRDATATKQQFLALWNPVARTYGLPVRAEPQV